VSSRYGLICLNHDPAIVIGGPESGILPDIETIAADPAAHGLPDHAHCELLIGRWSAALIEIGCPRQHWTTTDARVHYPFHSRGTEWIDVYWLHLLATVAARSATVMDDGLALAVKSAPGCWNARRALRLSSLLLTHTSREWSAKEG
jgi:hypothetical protein